MTGVAALFRGDVDSCRNYNLARPVGMAGGESTAREIAMDQAPSAPTAQEIANLVLERMNQDGGPEGPTSYYNW
jgi:hypothetical protein